MTTSKRISWFIPAAKFINVVLMTSIFAVGWFSYYESQTLTSGSRQVSILVLLLYVGLGYWLASRLGGYRIAVSRIRDIISSHAISAALTNSVCYMIIWMLSIHRPNLLPGLAVYAVQCVFLLVWALVSHKWYFLLQPPEEAVIVYDNASEISHLFKEYDMEKRYRVMATWHIHELTEHFELLDQAHTVFLYDICSFERNPLLKYCIANRKSVFIIPGIGDMIMSSAQKIHLFHLPMLYTSHYQPSTEFRLLKRGMDILLSGLALLVFSPLMLLVALAVKSDGGSALYRQKRLTMNGRVFEMLKFRSMVVDAEKLTGAVLSTGKSDPRITKIGRIIRSCRLDELPQLWNIFIGDMSLVGPRPERPEIAAQIEQNLPEFALRLQTRAGLTGYAQVYGKYNTTPYNKLLMDLMYIANPSILEDLCIMMSTLKILFVRESTEGVEEGKLAEMTAKKE